jgi:thiamine-monophosphate kinase
MVSGAIGDGWLGLRAARGELEGRAQDLEALIARYTLPEPRLALRELLLRHASACLDVSDGLIGDLAHLARASGVRLVLDLERTPLSGAGAAWLAGRPDPEEALAELGSGGDDYELAFSVPEAELDAVAEAALAAGVRVSRVGRVEQGDGVRVLYGGAEVRLLRTGWRHD